MMNTYNELTLLEAIAKEIKAEYAEEWNEPEELQAPSEVETFNNVIEDCIDAYIEECVEHFLSARSRVIEEDGRYLYSKDELDDFKTRFLEAGGNLDKLHIGMVYSKDQEICTKDEVDAKFLCYEVCRKKYYDFDTYYSRRKYKSGEEKKQIFFS